MDWNFIDWVGTATTQELSAHRCCSVRSCAFPFPVTLYRKSSNHFPNPIGQRIATGVSWGSRPHDRSLGLFILIQILTLLMTLLRIPRLSLSMKHWRQLCKPPLILSTDGRPAWLMASLLFQNGAIGPVRPSICCSEEHSKLLSLSLSPMSQPVFYLCEGCCWNEIRILRVQRDIQCWSSVSLGGPARSPAHQYIYSRPFPLHLLLISRAFEKAAYTPLPF